jgi:hypothetical protein
MIRKIVSADLKLLQAALSLLQQNKVLHDYAAIVEDSSLYTQVIRVKCDDSALDSIIRKRFKKHVRILK